MLGLLSRRLPSYGASMQAEIGRLAYLRASPLVILSWQNAKAGREGWSSGNKNSSSWSNAWRSSSPLIAGSMCASLLTVRNQAALSDSEIIERNVTTLPVENSLAAWPQILLEKAIRVFQDMVSWMRSWIRTARDKALMAWENGMQIIKRDFIPSLGRAAEGCRLTIRFALDGSINGMQYVVQALSTQLELLRNQLARMQDSLPGSGRSASSSVTVASDEGKQEEISPDSAAVSTATAEIVPPKENFYNKYWPFFILAAISGGVLAFVLLRRSRDIEYAKMAASKISKPAAKGTSAAAGHARGNHPRRASPSGPLQESEVVATVVREVLDVIKTNDLVSKAFGSSIKEGRMTVRRDAKTGRMTGEFSITGSVPAEQGRIEVTAVKLGGVDNSYQCTSIDVRLPGSKPFTIPLAQPSQQPNAQGTSGNKKKA